MTTTNATNSIRRLDNSLWLTTLTPPNASTSTPSAAQGIDIHISVPKFTQPEYAYRLAKIVKRTLQCEKISSIAQLAKGFVLSIASSHAQLKSSWKVSLKNPQCSLWQRIKQMIPFTHTIAPRRIKEIEVVQTSSSLSARVAALV